MRACLRTRLGSRNGCSWWVEQLPRKFGDVLTTIGVVIETFSAASAVELAVVERSGFVESRHVGSAVLVDPEGEVVLALGDASTPIFPRSTLKFFQAIASLNSGAVLTEEQVAIAAASHGGTARHVALVREILASVGLDDRALGCPPDWPLDRAARDQLVRAGEQKQPVCMNCSGKHAAMLAACVAQGWPLESYLDPEHPLQQQVREVIERLTTERPAASGVDGCGAPVHAISLTALARGVARVRTANPSSPFALFRNASRVAQAMLAHPWAVDGPGRPNTIVIEELGVIAKTGAEGVIVMAAEDGTTAAVKILDGSPRALTLVGLQLLVTAGKVAVADVQALVPRLELEVFGRGAQVGAIRIGKDVPLTLA
ncbi:asparaginase [Pseudoclavibacter alba]|nr:asparaginase [Pseudoclavibacter alba]